MIYRNRVIGVIDLESPQLNYFNEDHVRMFTTLAPQVAITIENARLYERVARSEARLENDLRRAQEIQMHLMPGIAPKVPGLEIALQFQPVCELGGDLYEFLSYGRDRQVVIVGDVSGKGRRHALRRHGQRHVAQPRPAQIAPAGDDEAAERDVSGAED